MGLLTWSHLVARPDARNLLSRIAHEALSCRALSDRRSTPYPPQPRTLSPLDARRLGLGESYKSRGHLPFVDHVCRAVLLVSLLQQSMLCAYSRRASSGVCRGALMACVGEASRHLGGWLKEPVCPLCSFCDGKHTRADAYPPWSVEMKQRVSSACTCMYKRARR